MKQCALVTGASSGIGEAIAHCLAKRGYNILLVARRKDKLKSVAMAIQSYGVEVDYKQIDLTKVADRISLCKYVRENHDLVCLVNNAGFGIHGYFHDQERETQLEMIELNVIALVDITHRLLPHLKNTQSKYNKKYILNISSIAGFQPGPFMAVYYASKSFVLMFSEALAQEMRYKKYEIVVSALCPGLTQSEFSIHAFKHTETSNSKNLLSKFFKKGDGFIPSAMRVAEYGINKMITHSQCVIIYGVLFKCFYQLQKIIPRPLVSMIIGKIQSGRQ